MLSHRSPSGILLAFAAVLLCSCNKGTLEAPLASLNSQTMIIDHRAANINLVPTTWVDKAKSDLRIAYGHTSHGSQLITGMTGLVSFKGTRYSFDDAGTNGALVLHDTPFPGASDLGNPDRTSWAGATRTYLTAHPEVNVVMWSWCGQVSSSTSGDIDTYLNLMAALEHDYPGVRFVYMTGHLDGTGLTGNLHIRNEQIRAFCTQNKKVLFDFADIESYDPDGAYYGDKSPNDNCDYDVNGDGTLEQNWAINWQNAHPGEWYSCSAAHSQPLNANRKAYAAWWLFARFAGWSGP